LPAVFGHPAEGDRYSIGVPELILVMYREGLPGRILFMGFAAILYFILGIRFRKTSSACSPSES